MTACEFAQYSQWLKALRDGKLQRLLPGCRSDDWQDAAVLLVPPPLGYAYRVKPELCEFYQVEMLDGRILYHTKCETAAERWVATNSGRHSGLKIKHYREVADA